MADRATKAAQAAMKVLDDDTAPLADRLVAHEALLQFGMVGAGDSAKLERMAEALGDVCLAVAVLMCAVSNPPAVPPASQGSPQRGH